MKLNIYIIYIIIRNVVDFAIITGDCIMLKYIRKTNENVFSSTFPPTSHDLQGMNHKMSYTEPTPHRAQHKLVIELYCFFLSAQNFFCLGDF